MNGLSLKGIKAITFRSKGYLFVEGMKMSIRRVHLRKLLRIMFLADGPRRSELRADIRQDRARVAGQRREGGADFYAPFWSDAKGHVFDRLDLHAATDERIAVNARRRDLYPQLRDGFLLWWEERRRWTNAPFEPGRQLGTQFSFPGLDAVVKVDNILSARDGRGEEHFVYPYFSKNPVLGEEAARLGLWLLGQALPSVPHHEIRILDVIRGAPFSIDRYPPIGSEENTFRDLYAALLEEWEALRAEYD